MLSIGSTSAFAQATPKQLTIKVENATAKADSLQGRKRSSNAARVGDRLRYVLTFTNTSSRAIRGVTIQDPIPAGLEYVSGSEKASRSDMAVSYTVDGKTFVSIPMEEVTIDGKTMSRPVAPERFRGVRWVDSSVLAPNASITAEFTAQLPRSSASTSAHSAATSSIASTNLPN